MITDMYVVGRIRQLADEDKISIAEEIKHFAKFLRLRNIEYDDLDETIEKDLQRRINEKAEILNEK